MNKTLIAACALRVKLDGDMVRLIPAGEFNAPRGALSGSGPWHLSESRGKQIITAAAGRSIDIVIDYEHQTLLAEQNGHPAPAAGWANSGSLEWRNDGIYGPVNWTAAATQAIDADEYRYLSPVFLYDENGEVLDLLHVALTNTPAIDTAVPALAAARMAATSSMQPEEDIMDKSKLIAALGLAKDATEEQIETALAALKSSSAEGKALRESLGLKDGEDAVTAVAALKSGAAPDMSKFVPAEVYEESQQQLAALKAGGETKELDDLIAKGLEDGRIAGQATADWLRKQGLAACKVHMEDAPSMAALKGGTQTQGKKPQEDGNDDLSESELAVCKNMGISKDDYRKANPKQAQ